MYSQATCMYTLMHTCTGLYMHVHACIRKCIRVHMMWHTCLACHVKIVTNFYRMYIHTHTNIIKRLSKIGSKSCLSVYCKSGVYSMYVHSRVETGSGHPGHLGHPGHILSGSSGSDPLYKISGSDPDITCVDDGVWLWWRWKCISQFCSRCFESGNW